MPGVDMSSSSLADSSMLSEGTKPPRDVLTGKLQVFFAFKIL